MIINHGKEVVSNNHLQSRYRPIPVVQEFLKRGYVVIIPMRQGFSHSDGSVLNPGCNITSHGSEQAKDLEPIIEWLTLQAWADVSQMIMMGQSIGGLATLAYAQNPHPGVKLFVNFAGGLKIFNPNCMWEMALQSALKTYGQNTKAATIWFYGENDSFFPPSVTQPGFEAYKQGNPNSEMIYFGSFGKDAHSMFGSYDGIPIWLPIIEKRMIERNLPTDIKYSQFTLSSDIVPPPASGFGLVSEIEKVPLRSAAAKNGYKEWLNAPFPKAFAIHPINGSWGSSWGSGELPYSRALINCERFAKEPCKLYAVDDRVVWN